MCIMTYINIYVIVIPQYEYNILVITQVQGEAKDAGITRILYSYWGITGLRSTD